MPQNIQTKPSLTVTLDAKSRTALLQIQQMTKSCFIAATVASTADIMQVFKGKPIKRVKKVVKKDWEDVATIAKTFNQKKKEFIVQRAVSMQMYYARGSELQLFWEEVAYAFNK